jgi:hypothetical protein
MTFDHRQAVEFARGGAIGERTEMAPVNLALDAWGGFEADERARLGGGWAYAGEVRPTRVMPPVQPCAARRCRSTTAGVGAALRRSR